MPLLARFLSSRDGRNSIRDIPGIVFRKQDYTDPSNASKKSTSCSDSYSLDSYPSDSCSSDTSVYPLYISDPAWIKNFDELPPPAMELVNHRFYSRSKGDVCSQSKGNADRGESESDDSDDQKTVAFFAENDAVASDRPEKKIATVRHGSTVVVAGRGCPMPCTYCSVGASSSHGRFRQRTVKDVINELSLQIERYNVGFVDFEDENLTLNRKWFLDLMSQIIKLSEGRSIELRAMNGLYPPSLDENMIIAMKMAGFKTLNLSLGSTSEEQLRRFKRPDVRKSFEQVLSIAERHGMETVSYLIAGAPDQEAQDSLDDLLFLAQKKTLAGLSIFYPAPGSVDFKLCRQKGLLPDHFSLMRSSALPIDHTTSRIQAVTLLRLARVLNFMKFLVKENGSIPEPEPCNITRSESALCNGGRFEPESCNIARSGPETRNGARSEVTPYYLAPSVRTGLKGKMEIARNSSRANSKEERNRVGIKLLKWFLHDGRLRGILHDGTVFEHNVDSELCSRFVQEIKRMKRVVSS
ncbi:MAG: radical SAM protein [Desulfamplus sp.]|nr:radical SAM protein [Desulfamplus sp.]